jgi:hypothetical protein
MEKRLTRGGHMIQWIGVLITLLGLAYTGVKDYQKGEIKVPYVNQTIQTNQRVRFAYQYCLMCYDPNVEKVYYQWSDGYWRDYAPPQQKIIISN